MSRKRSSRVVWTRLRWASCLIVITVAWLIWSGWWIPGEPSRWKYPIRGIDVSHHNGVIDWGRMRWGGVDFVFIKATEGSDWRDTRFRENWEGARREGIVRGAYHFFSTTSTGERQAANFIAFVPKTRGMLPPMIDLEFEPGHSSMSAADFHANLRVLISRLEAHYGVTPILYMPRRFQQHYFANKPVDRLWARSIARPPRVIAKNWMFWQYTDRGRAPGIKGRVDWNVFASGDPQFRDLQAAHGEAGALD